MARGNPSHNEQKPLPNFRQKLLQSWEITTVAKRQTSSTLYVRSRKQFNEFRPNRQVYLSQDNITLTTTHLKNDDHITSTSFINALQDVPTYPYASIPWKMFSVRPVTTSGTAHTKERALGLQGRLIRKLQRFSNTRGKRLRVLSRTNPHDTFTIIYDFSPSSKTINFEVTYSNYSSSTSSAIKVVHQLSPESIFAKQYWC